MADETTPSPFNVSRRGFVRAGAVGLTSAALGTGVSSCSREARGGQVHTLNRPGLGAAPQELFSAPPLEQVRIGFVGVGGMGSAHVRNLVDIAGCRIAAVCDIVEEKVTRMQDLVTEAGFPRPTGYSRGEWDFVRMCESETLDLVFTATPWRWHVPVCVAAMQNDKHAATEVPAATTIDECWQLVETAEQTRKHCVMMENVCYGRWEMMVLNMVRQDVFGEILHGEGGYLHDLRSIKFAPDGEGLWRREHSKTRNANLYPTHGLGPLAQCMNINRGDRFDYLVSMSGPSRGLQEYAGANFPADAPQRREQYVLGDINASLIQTVRGRTLYVSHDTNLPRPYSRIHMLQGTRGLFAGYPNRVYVEGRSEAHQWDEAESYLEEFEHPLWSQLSADAAGAGHGGMDFMEDYRLIKCLREGTATDMNVYDAASLSAVIGLSEISVANRSRSVDFPDFTRGRWESYPPLGIVEA